MKSPLKNSLLDTKATAQLLKTIPKHSTVQTYNFFTGDLEFSLCEYDYYITATTTRYVVYEFWHCMFEDSTRVYNILNNDKFSFEEDLFEFLQENFAKFKDQYIRSALFFMLNRCSDNGMVSYGKLSPKNYNRVALANLRTIKKPQNLILEHAKVSLNEHVQKNTVSDYRIVNAGKYNYNLFEYGKSYGLEETMIEHDKLLKTLLNKKEKTILIYNFSDRLLRHKSLDLLNVKLINQYGNVTNDKKSANEVIIANF